MRFQAYYRLTKPGIIYGNILTAAAGFFLGVGRHINVGLFLATLIGTSLVIAGACVFNNCQDRRLDAHMARTRQRSLVTGAINLQAALAYGIVLIVTGFLILILRTNWLVVMAGVIGFIDYVALYGWAKRHTPLSTLVGSISGATPIFAGYVAATGRVDRVAGLLFLLMVIWQMPHFYAIALFRREDYQAARLPLMPLRHDHSTTIWRMRGYIATFGIISIVSASYGHIGWVFGCLMTVLSFMWLQKTWSVPGDLIAKRGRRLFGFSLIVVLGLSVTLSLAPWLP